MGETEAEESEVEAVDCQRTQVGEVPGARGQGLLSHRRAVQSWASDPMSWGFLSHQKLVVNFDLVNIPSAQTLPEPQELSSIGFSGYCPAVDVV